MNWFFNWLMSRLSKTVGVREDLMLEALSRAYENFFHASVLMFTSSYADGVSLKRN